MKLPLFQADWRFPHCIDVGQKIDKAALLQNFSWIREMQNVPQEPAYHGEGDVLTHTMMVVDELIQLEEWQQLLPVEQNILFASALLHDVAKPICTKVEEDGRISSRGHARRGAAMTRNILSYPDQAHCVTPFNIREAVTALVRFHGLPLWFLEREEPEKEVFAASLQVRLDWVALLAEADARGRICEDQQELLTRIELFREFCHEHHCLKKSKQFPNNHTRFHYFRKEGAHSQYTAYDDTEFEVILLSGLPGVGKDTWIAKHCPDCPVISLDQIRKEQGISPTKAQDKVVQIAKQQAKEQLRKKQSFIWNATNLTRLIRKPLIDLFAAYGARVRIVYIEEPIDEVLRRNRSRVDEVPEKVIHKLLSKLEVPILTEAHEVEWII